MAADKLLAIDEVVYTRILRRDWAAPAELVGLLLLPASADEASGAGVGNGGDPGAAVAGKEGSVEQGVALGVSVF